MSRFRRYLNIDKRTIDEVENIISKKYFKKKFKDKFTMLKELNKKLSMIYKIKKCKITVVPHFVANKSKSNGMILIGDKLSLIHFLSNFKSNLNFQKRNTDDEEVDMKRDELDWALSVIEEANPEIINRIFKAKERLMLKEEARKEAEEELKHAIQLKGGKN